MIERHRVLQRDTMAFTTKVVLARRLAHMHDRSAHCAPGTHMIVSPQSPAACACVGAHSHSLPSFQHGMQPQHVTAWRIATLHGPSATVCPSLLLLSSLLLSSLLLLCSSHQQVVVGAHAKGCKCKKSRCVKKYCDCFDAQVRCSDICK